MTHDKSSASPNAIPQTTESDQDAGPSFGDVMAVADELFEHHKVAARLILYCLHDEFAKNGPLHGVSATDVAKDYSHCVSDVLMAGVYLARRRVIKMTIEEPQQEGACRCDACVAQRSWLELPYEFDADWKILEDRQHAEVQRAQREAQRIVNRRDRFEGFVYLIKCGERYKIGITNDMSRRMDQLRGQSPYPLELVHHAKGYNNAGKESTLHKRYGDHRVHGEWFELTPDQVAEIIEALNEWSRDEDGA